MDKGIEIYDQNSYDIVTNVFPRSFPKGQSIEIINSDIFKTAYENFTKEEHFEHVTNYFYSNSKNYSIFNFESKINLNNIRMAVDTRKDFHIIKQIISNFEKPHTNYDMSQILDIIERNKIKCLE